MKRKIVQIALVVDDYDKAINFYIQKLGFVLIEDSILSPTKRWVIIAPHQESSMRLLLAKASNDEQSSRIGNQTGGRVFLFMHTDDLETEHKMLIRNGIKIVRQPVIETWGKVLVFEDLYGNLWDLIEPTKSDLD